MKLTQIINYFFTKKISWTIIPEYQQSTFKQLLANFNDAYHYNEKADCEFITKSPLCRVYKIQINSKNYYFKKYNISRKKIQRYLGQSKVQTEWNNLLWFKSVQIPVAKVVAYGMETKGWVHHRGLLITEELINTSDLDSIRTSHPYLLKKRSWVAHISPQIARAARIMHQHHFAHNDFKWRNIMVDIKAELPDIFLIDCPSGMRWFKPLLEYRIIKDLACLDKCAKYELSQTQRLAFYKDYAQCQKLSLHDKKRIRKVLQFFNNRE